MSYPKAYSPEKGYKFQILVKCPGVREYEHCDYAVDEKDKKHLLDNYCQAYGAGFGFKTIPLPPKYWPRKAVQSLDSANQ